MALPGSQRCAKAESRSLPVVGARPQEPESRLLESVPAGFKRCQETSEPFGSRMHGPPSLPLQELHSSFPLLTQRPPFGPAVEAMHENSRPLDRGQTAQPVLPCGGEPKLEIRTMVSDYLLPSAFFRISSFGFGIYLLGLVPLGGCPPCTRRCTSSSMEPNEASIRCKVATSARDSRLAVKKFTIRRWVIFTSCLP
jgi:hypothetical protein